jgi:ribosomal 30S subunit maturation factor RimM
VWIPSNRRIVFAALNFGCPSEERAELPSGEFFQSELVGLQVIDVPTGSRWVSWRIVQHYGGPPLLVLTYEGREVLIPFVPEICNVDLSAKVIRATLPDGLLEL